MSNFLEDFPYVGPAAQAGFKTRANRYQGDQQYKRWGQTSVSLVDSTAVNITTVADNLDPTYGFDSAVIVGCDFRITSALSFSNSPVIKLQTAGGTASKLQIDDGYISDGDSSSFTGRVLAGDASGAAAVAALDLTTDTLQAKTTTIANNSSGTAGALVVAPIIQPKNVGR